MSWKALSRWSWLGLMVPMVVACSGGDKDDDDDDDDDDTLPWMSTGDDDDDTAQDTARGRDDTGGRRDTTVAPANMIDDDTLLVGVDCDSDRVTFEFDFLGDSSSGWIDIADTANQNNWNETHTLDALAFGGGRTVLGTPSILVVSSAGAVGDQSGTLFTCSFYDDRDLMTYMVRAYDLTGSLADCVAWGDDPSGFIDGGDYIQFNSRPTESEITQANCRTVGEAR